MELLDNPIRDYAWGSRTSIAAMQGRTVPAAGPEAELWMGAHPDSPSTVCRHGRQVSFGDVVAADPQGVLGPAAFARFGSRLPFMLKVLAADSPLSLQAHPDAGMAAQRYADEEATGAPPGAAGRNYADRYAKPELLVAVDHFDALCGFRDPDDSARVLASLRVPQLARVVEVLGSGPVDQRLRGAVEDLLRWPADQRESLVAAVVAAVGTPERADVAAVSGFVADLGYVAELARRFPADPGVVVAMLLNHVRLTPGEAIWMPAGYPHAYLRGTGVEVLAASDNVLRGGLTTKRIDIEELLRILRFEVLAEPVVAPVPVAPGVLTWPVPVAEFALWQVRPTGTGIDLTVAGPRIVFCAAGTAVVDDGDAQVSLRSGQAALGRAGRQMAITGNATVYVATTGVL